MRTTSSLASHYFWCLEAPIAWWSWCMCSYHLRRRVECEEQPWSRLYPSFKIWARSAFGFWNLALFTMYTNDRQKDRRQTDGRMDKSNAYCPLQYVRGHNKHIQLYVLTARPCSYQHSTSVAIYEYIQQHSTAQSSAVLTCLSNFTSSAKRKVSEYLLRISGKFTYLITYMCQRCAIWWV